MLMDSSSPRFRSLRTWTSADGRICYHRHHKHWYVGLGLAARASDQQLSRHHQFAATSWRTIDDAYRGVALHYDKDPPARELCTLGTDLIQETDYVVQKINGSWGVYSMQQKLGQEYQAFRSVFENVVFPTRRAAGEALLEWLEQYRLERAA
jgi:hypothetical protein